MQNGKDFKVGIAIIALALTVAICLGGFHIYKEYGVKKPLTESILEIDGVQKAVIEDGRDGRVINVTLKDTANLKGSFQKVNEVAREKLGDKQPYVIKIVDNPSPELRSLYDDLELGIHQGIADSSFIWLKDWIGQVTADKGTEYQLQVDSDNLYFTISKHGHYLMRIIERDKSTQSYGRGDTDA